MNQNKFTEAENCFRDAINKNPLYADAHANLGNVLRREDKHDGAISSYQAAAVIKNDHAECYQGLGNIFYNLGKYSEAIANYYRAIKINPHNNDAKRNLAIALIYYEPKRYSDQLANQYLEMLSLGIAVQPIRLSRSTIALLKCHDTIRGVICASKQSNFEGMIVTCCTGLSKIPLLMKIMELSYSRPRG